MFLTSTKWVLIAAVGLLTAAGVTGRPWEGDTDIRSGGLAERNFAMFNLCPDAAARCSAQQGLGAYFCFLRNCPRAINENVLRQALDVCWPEVAAQSNDVTSGTCAFAVCLKRRLGSNSDRDIFDGLVETACMDESDIVPEVESCILACREQTEEDFGNCVETYCVADSTLSDEPVKRMTTRMNGCKTAIDCQMELRSRVGKRVSELDMTAEKRVSSRVNGCKTPACVMRLSGLSKKWSDAKRDGEVAKRVTTRMNSCSTAEECGNQLLHMMGDKRRAIKGKRVVSRLNGCQTAEECQRLLTGKRIPSDVRATSPDQKRMSSRVNGCRNPAECEGQLLAALGGK